MRSADSPPTPPNLAALRAKLEPPWDEVRERRVLSAILQERRTTGRPRGRVQTWVWAAAAAASVALVIVGWQSHSWHRGAPAATLSPGPSTLALADGSTAVLAPEARMQVEEQRPDRVHLVQSQGSVRYEVRPDPAREFVVTAADTTVRVRGTVFTVDVQPDGVRVEVQRGRVEVTHAGVARDLVVGESLRVPTGSGAVPSAEPPLPSASSSADVLPSGMVTDRGADPRGPMDVPSAAALQAQADAARVAGDNALAATALERLVALYPRDSRISSALFTLGRVNRARGMLGASARAFDRCFAAAPGRPLAQDALTEAAQAWASAGDVDAARQDASRYLGRWPQGPAADRMRAILKQ